MSAPIDKFFVMAMAATGKSTFVRRHPHYRGYRVVDFAEELPPQRLSTRILLYLARFIPAIRKAIHNRSDVKDRYRQAYFDKAFAFMDACEEPLVLLGRRTRNNYKELGVHDRVRFSMVLIPEERHRNQVASRKSTMRNFLPRFHHWTTDFERVRKIRGEMRAYADKFDIPVYDSIEGAIDAMHEAYGDGSQEN
ncbi:MAG: hypothetical protein KJO56_12800 [Gammaproteobacteria bacterium]|nr:hypothetical protein [Gammaproteobacteria bacterium]